VKEALVFAWLVGMGYTWGRVMVYMRRHEQDPLSIEGGVYAAAAFFIWPILLGYVSGDQEEG